MDTYGHLFPGQEVDAVNQMRGMFSGPPEALRATGTDNATAEAATGAQRQSQQSQREIQRTDATVCEEAAESAAQRESPKPLAIADLDDDVRRDATDDESTPGRIRTCDLRIRSPLLYPAELRAQSSSTTTSPPGWLPSIASTLPPKFPATTSSANNIDATSHSTKDNVLRNRSRRDYSACEPQTPNAFAQRHVTKCPGSARRIPGGTRGTPRHSVRDTAAAGGSRIQDPAAK